jgi:glycerate-2-kinase
MADGGWRDGRAIRAICHLLSAIRNYDRAAVDLKAIYLTTLERCAPEKLVQRVVARDMPRNVVAIGKCAGALLDGVVEVLDVESAFVAIPEGYRLPKANAELHIGGHPQMTRASFETGRALLQFVDARRDILFLVSGGGSACVEVPLAGHTEDELMERNARLVASGLPIGAINAERKKFSAIKGGRLGERVRGNVVTLVYSDVGTDQHGDVASGPSYRDMILIADNDTFTQAAADIIGEGAYRLGWQLDFDITEAADILAGGPPKEMQVLVAGGEPTVAIKGPGRGGRCCELAVRFAMQSTSEALFASSDGVDGNSGVAGIYLPDRQECLSSTEAQAALDASDSLRIAAQVGEPIMITPSGNNLRDLFLVARN